MHDGDVFMAALDAGLVDAHVARLTCHRGRGLPRRSGARAATAVWAPPAPVRPTGSLATHGTL
jgi:hypothetical protein